MKFLFYVEPVTYRFDPFFLRPWLTWIADMARSQRDDDSAPKFAFMSSPWLCRSFSLEFQNDADIIPIRPADVLAPFDMDRSAYGQDLAQPAGATIGNVPLQQALTAAVDAFRPDAVISFSQNRYLQRLQSRTNVFFTERQPLPRLSGKGGFFLDNSGHQTESLLVTQASRIKSLMLPESVSAGATSWWSNYFDDPVDRHPDTTQIRDWIDAKAAGNPVVMLALQPPDWLTLEGLSTNTPLDGVLMRWLSQVPHNWRAITTYHPAIRLPRALEELIAEQFPHLLLLPEVWNQGHSELVIDAVDAVATISSAVGFTALLSGKQVVALGRSNLSGLAAPRLSELNQTPSLTEPERVNLLAFLTNFYCHDDHDILAGRGYLTRTVSELIKGGTDRYFEFPHGTTTTRHYPT